MDKGEKFELALDELKRRTENERDLIANLSNASAVLKACMEDVNWLGFYIMKDGQLVLGPFQGLAAVSRIEVGEGVCGAAVQQDEIQLVADVHAFPGHIACDIRSKSEIVIPVHSGGKVCGVLDVDSPVLSRFDETDSKYLKAAAEILEGCCKW